MNGQSPVDIILQAYTFKREKPIYTNSNYNVYEGIQTDTKLPVTIKILKPFHFQLPKYLKKIKQCRSENVIKIYDIASDNSTLVFITEKVTYGNMKDALNKCERLDDSDSVFIAKLILNGHIDLLRTDCNWFGTQQDIQFTDGGLKLSWNNSIGFNLVNPIPRILQKISMRPQDKGGDINLLPFPKNKIILDLIKVSKENASQISLNPNMKKKQKFSKKKGKNWLGLKQYKNKNQYFQQITYFAISPQYGFIRAKSYSAGKLNPAIIALNKNKSTFTKILDQYQENGKTYVLADYSNDGNLQAYVTKLKTSNVTLTQDHIQFFFYSLFQPLKMVQQSSLKSINMLHIRNIYIQNGIPKIGDPIPLNETTQNLLIDRSDVPDFYHKQFKKRPSSHLQTYDTYSLGVLLYKLMYTQYPIFPNEQVHIPTTPNYNSRLKKTLKLFLNQGGRLKDIQNQIEISENVLKQVKQNKQKLIVSVKKQKSKGTIQNLMKDIEQSDRHTVSQKSDASVVHEQDEDNMGCCQLCCMKLQLNPNQQAGSRFVGIASLQQSPYRIYRICTKILFVLSLYIFLFYFFFIQNNVLFLANQNLLTNYSVTIATVDYQIITTDVNVFQTSFNTTQKTVDSLQSMGCLINDYDGNPNYSEYVKDQSLGWLGYLLAAILSLVLILGLKVWQIYKFDYVRMLYNYDHKKYNFNISHFIIFNLLWITLIHGHYYFFNFIFRGQTQPCVGGLDPFESTNNLFNNLPNFQLIYLSTICLQAAATIGHAIMIGFTYRVKYNKLLNPIFIFGTLLLVQWVIIRIGVLDGYFAPNALQDSNNIILGFFIDISYINILGIVPEILLILQFLISGIIDLIYWSCLDKRRRLLIHQNSAASIQEL